jgi:hypothetical protein
MTKASNQLSKNASRFVNNTFYSFVVVAWKKINKIHRMNDVKLIEFKFSLFSFGTFILEQCCELHNRQDNDTMLLL